MLLMIGFYLFTALMLVADIAIVLRSNINKKKKISFIAMCAVSLGLGGLPVFISGNKSIYTFIIICVIAVFNIITVYDIRTMHIPNILLYALNALGFVCSFFVSGTFFIRVLLSAWLITGICFLISYKSKGKIGLGDLFCMSGLMMCMPFDSMMSFMILSLFTAAAYSIIMIILKKKTMREEIPFAPFMLIGFLGAVIV